MNIEIYLMSGAGNLFTVIDNRNLLIDEKFVTQNHKLLTENLLENGLKTEGIMLLELNTNNTTDNINNIENKTNYDFVCKFFNPDGSSGMMCGNGGRCISKFALDKLFPYFFKESEDKNSKLKEFNFFMAGNIYKSIVYKNNYVDLYLPKHNLIEKRKLKTNNLNENLEFTYINNGSDHSVFFINVETEEDFWNFDLLSFAPEIRNNSMFPNGTNVNIFTLCKDELCEDKLLLRTFERGVEAETGACGTGSVATAITSILDFNLRLPIKIIPTSKSELRINMIDLPSQPKYEIQDFDNIQNYILSGSAEYIKNINIEI